MCGDFTAYAAAVPHPDDDRPNGLSEHLRPRTLRHDDGHLSTRLDDHGDLRDGAGDVLLGAVMFAADVATGIQSGLAVLERDLWIVTTDLAVHLAEPVRTGPVRVDAEVVRVGATTVVARCEIWDDGEDRRVGAGTATGRPFTFDFDRRLLQYPVGREVTVSGPEPVRAEPVLDRIGIRAADPTGPPGLAGPADPGGAARELELRPWVCNPWGILHGGASAFLVEDAARAAVAAEGLVPSPRSMTLRFLAPSRVGPVRAVPRVLASAGRRDVVEVEVRDVGNDDRRSVLATVELASP